MSAPAQEEAALARVSRIVAALPSVLPFVAPEALERRQGAAFLLRLGANENPWGCSPIVTRLGETLADRSRYYSDPESYDLRTRLAETHRCALDNLTVGEGIDGLLGLVVRGFVDPGDAVVMTHGSYPTFAYHARGYGAKLVEVEYERGRPPLDAMLAAAEKTRAKLLYLANPDNPSGTFFTKSVVQALVSSLPSGCTLVLDEAYADFLEPSEVAEIPIEAPVLRLRTFSKAYGLAGARLGYMFGPAEVTVALNKIRLHFGVSLASQLMCLAAMEDPSHVVRVRRETALGRLEYEHLGHELGLANLPSGTNFVTFDVGSERASQLWVQALAEARVFVRRPGTGALRTCIRISVGLPSERAQLRSVMNALRRKLGVAKGNDT